MDETKNLVNNDFKDIMFDRHSYRKFQSDVKISREEISEMLEETITAPSACNLQSWHFVVCDDEEGKKKAHSVMMPFNYPQTDSCSAIIFVLGDTQSHYKYRDVWNKACENGQISLRNVIRSSRHSYLCMNMLTEVSLKRMLQSTAVWLLCNCY